MFARQSQRGAEAIVPSFAFRNTGKQEPNGSVCVCEVVRVKLCVCDQQLMSEGLLFLRTILQNPKTVCVFDFVTYVLTKQIKGVRTCSFLRGKVTTTTESLHLRDHGLGGVAVIVVRIVLILAEELPLSVLDIVGLNTSFMVGHLLQEEPVPLDGWPVPLPAVADRHPPHEFHDGACLSEGGGVAQTIEDLLTTLG